MKDNLHSKHNYPSKKLGPLAAHLISRLYELNRKVFHFSEAANILNSYTTAANVLSQLIFNGVVTRLKPGTFRLVPFEMGFEREYLGNPYVVARELALSGRHHTNNEYYLSHGSAFDIHQMATQPQFIVYVSSPRMVRPRIIQGTEFRFVRCKKINFFGIKETWVENNEKVQVSDLERTLLDGLKQPSYCGGFSEVAKAFSIKHSSIDPQKIIDYAIKLNIGVVIRRLGYIMELYEIGSRAHWELLQSKITSSYLLLDPDLPATGPHLAKWRLQLNISEEELFAIRET